MHFLDVNAVVNDLKYGRLGEEETMKYVMATLIIDALSVFGTGSQAGPLFSFFSFGSAVCVLACWKVNRVGDNKDFLKRFYCISFPINICLMLITTIFFVIFGVAAVAVPALVMQKTLLYSLAVVFGGVIGKLKFLWIRRCLGIVSAKVEELPVA